MFSSFQHMPKYCCKAEIAAHLCNHQCLSAIRVDSNFSFSFPSLVFAVFMSLLLVQLASSEDSQKRSGLLTKRAGNKNTFQKASTTTTEASYDVSEACLYDFCRKYLLNCFDKHFLGRRLRRRWSCAWRKRWWRISQFHLYNNWGA